MTRFFLGGCGMAVALAVGFALVDRGDVAVTCLGAALVAILGAFAMRR